MPKHFVKYPRTPHLPWSLGRTDDDKVIESLDTLKNSARIIVTEKYDGENTTFYKEGIHARSINNTNHPSRSWVKRWHGSIAWQLPSNLRFCGENLYAYHSIRYWSIDLKNGYFVLFNIWDGETCLSWAETARIASQFNIPLVPVLYDGVWDENAIKACYTNNSTYDGEQEGYVVRTADSFSRADFSLNVAKYVRENHVQSDKHWTEQQELPNGSTLAEWQAWRKTQPDAW